MRSILIVGLKEKDAGKTTLALALLKYLRENGINACSFKPKAGNCLWYDYDVVYEALSQARLYGKDAKLLKEASDTSLNEEVINPIHRLWAEDFMWKRIERLPNFLLDRVTLLKDELRFILIANKPLLSKYHECKELLRGLYSNAKEVIEVYDIEQLNKVICKYYDKAIALAYEKIKQNSEFVVVESYSDVALPWEGIENIEVVFGVEPWQISIYDPDKYLTTIKLFSQLRYKEITTREVCKLLKPIKEIRIPPLLSKEIVEKLKDKIEKLKLLENLK
jgi:predicted P-loop ATPase/GTPase